MAVLGNRILPDAIKWGRSANAQVVSRKYQLRLATPMFGGGVIAGTSDERMPIRPSSIRGHLRYWWRMMHREKFLKDDRTLDVAAMRLREAEIWGSTELPSAVQVEVEVQDSVMKACGAWTEYVKRNGDIGIEFKWVPPLDIEWGGRGSPTLSYALFPFMGEAANGIDGATCVIECEFRLKLCWHQLADTGIRDEVENSVGAWISWGGIGARTRRGCGTLATVDELGRGSRLPPRCQLFLGKSAGMKPGDAINAWADGILRLQEFRQTLHRNSGPGRTKWPEPDSLRDATGCTLPKHNVPIDASVIGTYPKAVLGLPIVFHFKDSPSGDRPSADKDPLDVSLEPDVGGAGDDARMASPIVIRPFFDVSQGWRPAVMLMPHDHLTSLQCKLKSKHATFLPGKNLVPTSSIRGTSVAKVQPLAAHGVDNAVDAFLEYCKSKGYAEVNLP